MNNTALVIIDVQNGMFAHGEQPHDGAGVLARIGGLVARARADAIPLIFVQHDGGPGHPLEKPHDGWRVHPATGYLDGDTVVEKLYCDAFQSTQLHHMLQQQNIRKLVIAGLMTQYCIDTSCRRAFSLGYKVTLAQDAHSTYDRKTLTATQIIAHHNEVLGSDFVELQPADSITFRYEDVTA